MLLRSFLYQLLPARRLGFVGHMFRDAWTDVSYNLCPGRHSPIWAIRGHAAGQGMVFWPRCPKQGIQFDLPPSALNRVRTCPKHGMVTSRETLKSCRSRECAFFSVDLNRVLKWRLLS